jgi:polyisoprenoid-binding protein YceI
MKSFAAVALAGLLAPLALSQPQTLAVDPAASQVGITLKTTHEIVNGSFHVDSGSIRFDRSSPNLSGNIVIAAASGKTGNGSRDKKMDKDILHVAQYDTISFAPKTCSGSIPTAGDSTIQVSGTFTLLGKPHEITIPVALHIDGSSATARAHFVVPYVQWGLKNPSFLIWKAENDVAVDLDLVGAISK